MMPFRIGAVTKIGTLLIHLSLTRHQVKDLPPVDIDYPSRVDLSFPDNTAGIATAGSCGEVVRVPAVRLDAPGAASSELAEIMGERA